LSAKTQIHGSEFVPRLSMFLNDPPPTQADIYFRVFGFPVRIHPFFWVMTLLLGLGGGPAEPTRVVVWVAVVFVSILIHELGHAVVIRYFGGHPRIVLYSFGGMAIDERPQRTPSQQILISFAGPAAGFMLAAVVIAIITAAGHFDGFDLALMPVQYELFDLDFARQNGRFSFRDLLILDLLYINILWGLINLLPIYPLDGGHISRELFVLNDPWKGIAWSLALSTFAAAAVAVYALVALRTFYTAFFFGYLAYSSWATLQAYSGRGPRW